MALAHGQTGCAALIEADPCLVLIHDVCFQGKVLLVVALLKQGCPPGFRDEREGKGAQTPLMAACAGGKYNVVKVLLGYAAVLTGKDEADAKGQTALMKAAAAGALDITGLLLSVGCDRNARDKAGLTTRDHALKHGYSTMFQYMSQQIIH